METTRKEATAAEIGLARFFKNVSNAVVPFSVWPPWWPYEAEMTDAQKARVAALDAESE